MDGSYDKACLKTCIEDMKKFDRIVGHYSARFDIPFLRSRAIHHKVKFPEYKDLLHTDTWRMARNALCISNNRQDTVARLVSGESAKTRIEGKYWMRALQGDEESIKWILDHCRKDVHDLQKNFEGLQPYCRMGQGSI